MAWADLVGRAIDLRRALHRQPELAWHEEQTARTIRAQLDRLAIPWRPCAGTGTIGRLAADAPGRHIALRADIDALPITEKSGRPWASERSGYMHACGHDGHTATLMAAAAWLAERRAILPGPVSLIFQPAEEGGHGAKGMIADGALDGVDVIFGWHNWPALPLGRALCPDGTVMCANGSFAIDVIGRGGHASQPENCRDPVLGAAAIVLALQQIVSRGTAPQTAAVVSATGLVAESADTVIPGSARINGSVRALTTAARAELNAAIERVASATARAYGVEARVEIRPRYGATVNHPAPAADMRRALDAVLGDWRDPAHPVPLTASEDFSYYLDVCPGAFAIIGAGAPDGTTPPCHNAAYDFEDRLIDPVARIYAALAGAPIPTHQESPRS